MKLLIDMNLSPRWADVLASAGFESKHWSVLGPGKAPDFEIMAYAAKHDYVVLTHDLDFSAILAATQGKKPSVVQLRTEDISPQSVGARLVVVLRQMERELEVGALLTVGQQRSRLRLLPLLPSD